MKKIKLTPKAEDDLTAIWNYSYSNFGEAKADEYISRLGDIFEVIATHKIGIARPELEASIFSLPIEHHIIFFIPSDSNHHHCPYSPSATRCHFEFTLAIILYY